MKRYKVSCVYTHRISQYPLFMMEGKPLRWKSVALNYGLPCTLMHGTGGIKYHAKYFRFHSFNVKRAILVSWTVLEGFQMFEQMYSSYNMYINCKFTFLYPEA